MKNLKQTDWSYLTQTQWKKRLATLKRGVTVKGEAQLSKNFDSQNIIPLIPLCALAAYCSCICQCSGTTFQ